MTGGDWADEWDDQMSGDYQDGYDRGQEDAMAGRPYDGLGPVSAQWHEGWRDGFEDAQVKNAATRRGA